MVAYSEPSMTNGYLAKVTLAVVLIIDNFA